MLSFQITDSGNAVHIFCDSDGLEVLMKKLASLRTNPGHIHLWGPSIGAEDLSETTPVGDAAVAEVIINYNPSN